MQLSKLIHVANDIQVKQSSETLPSWSFRELAGRLVTISGRGNRASLSLCANLILEVQQNRDYCIWLSRGDSVFYPPDFQERGIDLAALPVVRTPNFSSRLQALDQLLRSGAFALILFDHDGPKCFPLRLQGRLAGLAQRHHVAVVSICDRDSKQGSMGTMTSLHAKAQRQYEGQGRFRCTLSALKDKQRGPGWSTSEVFDAPIGLY